MRTEISVSTYMMVCMVMSWLVVCSGRVSAVAGVGDPAPNFSLTDAISGNTITLADYEDKVVLLDFFATFCPHCIQAFDDDLVPLFNQSYADDPWVMFLSIDVWQSGITAEQLQNFASDHGVEWPILMGSDSSIIQDYGVTCIPTIFIIDGDGLIRYRYSCGSPAAEVLREEIDALRVPLATDTNCDGLVDIFDLFTVAVPFGSTPDDPNWNPAADINNDDIIDTLDVTSVDDHFGNTV